MSRTTPHFRYDPLLGDPHAAYSRANDGANGAAQPELAGVFIADVDGETMLNTMNGRQSLAWQAQPGTPCTILGYWSDGTVHLRWPAINGAYQIDGRFPSWVVKRDDNALMAGGGRWLPASSPPEPRRGLSSRVVAIARILVLAGCVLLLAVFIVRDVLGVFQ